MILQDLLSRFKNYFIDLCGEDWEQIDCFIPEKEVPYPVNYRKNQEVLDIRHCGIQEVIIRIKGR